MRLRAVATLAAVVGLWSAPALADRVALLPARGADDAETRTTAERNLAAALSALHHEAVAETEIRSALASIGDGVADTVEEYAAVGQATRADWVLVATVEPAVLTERVELAACLVSAGRLESVAREVDKARSPDQIREMVAVLLRPEGIGAGALPWERSSTPAAPPAPVAPTPVPPPPQTPEPRVARLGYLSGAADAWPPYSAGRTVGLGARLGVSAGALRPEGASGSSASLVGAVRAAFAVGASGFEPLVELGGNLAGPRALWIEGGARLMLTPLLRRSDDGKRWEGPPFHVGPELALGAFVRLPPDDVVEVGGATYSGSAEAAFSLRASLAATLDVSRSVRLDASLGDLRWVPSADGSIVLVGGTLGLTLRL